MEVILAFLGRMLKKPPLFWIKDESSHSSNIQRKMAKGKPKKRASIDIDGKHIAHRKHLPIFQDGIKIVVYVQRTKPKS